VDARTTAGLETGATIPEKNIFKRSEAQKLLYSYRSASIGSRLAAFQAG